jgi:hypothetical protein
MTERLSPEVLITIFEESMFVNPGRKSVKLSEALTPDIAVQEKEILHSRPANAEVPKDNFEFLYLVSKTISEVMLTLFIVEIIGLDNG